MYVLPYRCIANFSSTRDAKSIHQPGEPGFCLHKINYIDKRRGRRVSSQMGSNLMRRFEEGRQKAIYRASKSWYPGYPGYWGTFPKTIKIEEQFERLPNSFVVCCHLSNNVSLKLLFPQLTCITSSVHSGYLFPFIFSIRSNIYWTFLSFC